MRLLTSNEMQLVEQYTAKYGLSFQRMMENAGAACTRNIRNVLEAEHISGKKIVVVCGKGNNGGDGFVIARKFAENGYNVCVILSSGYPSSPEATYMYKLVLDLSIPTIWYDADKSKAIRTVENADIIVDAVFGFSFYGNISEELRELFSAVSSAKGLKFSVDLPSGVYCDSGYYDEGCIRADYTIAISALKPAHIMHPASECCGDIIIANIGIPEESYSVVADSLYTYDKTEVRKCFPVRKSTDHKGSFGHLLCICGSRGMTGAAVLSASAALRSGVGLVTVALPESAYIPVSTRLTEALMLPLKENESGTLSKECIPELLESLDKYDAVLIGCGMGVNEDTVAVLRAVVENTSVPVIIDADGINALALDINIIQGAKGRLVLTPHPKEMSRLTGEDVQLILSDAVGCAGRFSQEKGVYTVLKSANTVVAQPDAKRIYVNAPGNNGLAKGGSGDVLAGLMGGFAAQSFRLIDAITSAVYIHSHTADIVAQRSSKTGMLPSDIVDELRTVFRYFEK